MLYYKLRTNTKSVVMPDVNHRVTFKLRIKKVGYEEIEQIAIDEINLTVGKM